MTGFPVGFDWLPLPEKERPLKIRRVNRNAVTIRKAMRWTPLNLPASNARDGRISAQRVVGGTCQLTGVLSLELANRYPQFCRSGIDPALSSEEPNPAASTAAVLKDCLATWPACADERFVEWPFWLASLITGLSHNSFPSDQYTKPEYVQKTGWILCG